MVPYGLTPKHKYTISGVFELIFSEVLSLVSWLEVKLILNFVCTVCLFLFQNTKQILEGKYFTNAFSSGEYMNCVY